MYITSRYIFVFMMLTDRVEISFISILLNSITEIKNIYILFLLQV